MLCWGLLLAVSAGFFLAILLAAITNRGGYITEVCKDYLLHWEDKQQEFDSI